MDYCNTETESEREERIGGGKGEFLIGEIDSKGNPIERSVKKEKREVVRYFF